MKPRHAPLSLLVLTLLANSALAVDAPAPTFPPHAIARSELRVLRYVFAPLAPESGPLADR